MRKEYDFSKGKRGAIVQNKGKTRITIFLDDAVLRQFRALSQSTGKGYQTLINEALNAHMGLGGEPMTTELVRRIVREELASESEQSLEGAVRRGQFGARALEDRVRPRSEENTSELQSLRHLVCRLQ